MVMIWYAVIAVVALLLGAALFAAGALFFWRMRVKEADSPSACPGPPAERRPCWGDNRGRRLEEVSRFPQLWGNGFPVYLFGGRSPCQVEVVLECDDDRDWLVIQSGGGSVELPVGGSAAVVLAPNEFDRFVADLGIGQLTATVRCLMPSEGGDLELRVSFDLEKHRLGTLSQMGLALAPVETAHPLSGKVTLEVMSPHPFPVKLDKFVVRGLGMRLRERLDSVTIDPGDSTTLTLLLTGPPANWERQIDAHLKARVSYQGQRGVTCDRPFKLVPQMPAGFGQREEQGELDATATVREWEASLPLPTAPTGCTVECQRLTVVVSGARKEVSLDWHDGTVTVDIPDADGLQAIFETGRLKFTSPEDRTPQQWPTLVEIDLVLAHDLSDFQVRSKQVIAYREPPPAATP